MVVCEGACENKAYTQRSLHSGALSFKVHDQAGSLGRVLACLECLTLILFIERGPLTLGLLQETGD